MALLNVLLIHMVIRNLEDIDVYLDKYQYWLYCKTTFSSESWQLTSLPIWLRNSCCPASCVALETYKIWTIFFFFVMHLCFYVRYLCKTTVGEITGSDLLQSLHLQIGS
jgi:hypothetical protein